MRHTLVQALVTGAALASGAPAIAAEPPGTWIDLRRTRAGLVALEIEIGGERFEAALDTGSSITMVSAGVAQRLRLQPRARSTVVDAGGRERPLLLSGPVELRLGSERTSLAGVAWTPGLAELPGADGLTVVLGADALASADALFTAGARRLRVAPGGTLATWIEGEAVALAAIEGRPALEIELGAARGSVVATLVVDSGANAPVLFGAAATALAAGAGGSARTAFLTAGGGTEVSTARLGRAHVGTRALKLGDAALLPGVTDRTETGLVPLDALGPIMLDLASSRAVLGARLRSTPSTSPATIVAAATP